MEDRHHVRSRPNSSRDNSSRSRNRSRSKSCSERPKVSERQSRRSHEFPKRSRSDRPPVSQHPSRDSSAHSERSVRSSHSSASAAFLDGIKHEVMSSYLYQQQCTHMWVSESQGVPEGCVVRKSRGHYLACPPTLVDSTFAKAMNHLNVQCAMTVNSRIIKAFLTWSPEAVDVPLRNGLRIQMLPSMDDVANCKKAQNAAFVAKEGILVIWDDDALHLITRAMEIEDELMKVVWASDQKDEPEEKPPADNEGKKVVQRAAVVGFDEEGQMLTKKRQLHLMNSFLVSLTLLAVMLLLGAAIRQIAIEVHTDGFWPRIGLICLFPVQIFFTLFFCQVIFGSFAQMFGPIRQLEGNSKYYSARLPPRLVGVELPHVTIQCPVYKEGLQAVIVPTIRSLKEAMSTYELQGGSVNLYVNDDGLQLLDEAERQARIEFYADNNIGWVARPPHGENGFQRRGKFKKASNMNYALYISNTVEGLLARVQRSRDWTNHDESEVYNKALQQAIVETGRVAWADGNIRIGDYILLVDSDTRVPTDCLLDAVSEMEQSPEVAILQFSSGVMQVVHHFFENGITFFTDLIYSAIRYTVANGDVAPFVGHNAIIRWSALQSVSYEDADRYEKFWSESHVSEDFDMSLRLQCAGYIVRLAAWAGEGFKEGVSLTVYDELARWEKYAYGCNELLFHPLRKWIYRGPFTPLFREFVGSGIPLTSKITVISYIGTYYAIAAAWVLTTVDYFIVGWWGDVLDRYYVDSWQVWFSIIIVFNGLGNVALAVMRYRVNEKPLLYSLYENFKWTTMLAIFLGGLSLHLSSALLAHMFEIDTTWGATSKEFTFSNFFMEVPKVMRKFKVAMVLFTLLIAVMVVMAVAPFVPWDWRITDFVAILPMATVALSHILLPIALNPALMTFSW